MTKLFQLHKARLLLSIVLATLVTISASKASTNENPKSSEDPSCYNPLLGAQGFNAFVASDTQLVSGDTEGPIATGKDLYLNGNVTIAAQNPGNYIVQNEAMPSALIIGNQIKYLQGEGVYLNRGFVKLGNATESVVYVQDKNSVPANTRITPSGYEAKPRVQVQRMQSNESVLLDSGIDFKTVFDNLKKQSEILANISPNNTISADRKISLNSKTVNVFAISADQLIDLSYLTFEDKPSKDTPVVFNVNTLADFEWEITNLAGISDQDGSHIIWNFYNNSNLTLQGGGTVIGSILAPSSVVTKSSSGNVNGQLIAQNYIHQQGELHHYPFDGCIPAQECTLAVEASEDQIICKGKEVVLTASISGASVCKDCDSRALENTIHCKAGYEYFLWLADADNENVSTFNNVDVVWRTYPDGTATLQGSVVNTLDDDFILLVDVRYSGRTRTAESGSPKLHYCYSEVDADWVYYTEVSGTIRNPDGTWSFDISRMGPAFQIGKGANVTESQEGKYGASGWFFTTDGYYTKGDFNFNIGDCLAPQETTVSYVWSTGETTPSITVSPDETTSYTVRVSDCLFCDATDSTKVVVTQPVAVSLGEDVSICKGETQILTAKVAGEGSCKTCVSYGLQNTDYCLGDQNFVLWIKQEDGQRRWFSDVDLVWSEFDDGTATLQGSVYDYFFSKENFEVDVIFSGKTTTPPAGSPKAHDCHPESTTAWEYYTDTKGSITSQDGTVLLNVSRRGEAFQKGKGANNFEKEKGKYGASGWITLTGDIQAIGDFNINFGNCISQENKGFNYLWSTGETTASIAVSPTEMTTYSVTVDGCIDCGKVTDEISVTVNEIQVDAGEDQNICIGESATLTAQTDGDVLWSTGETTKTIVVSPRETKIYSVTAQKGDCEARDTVRVSILPIQIDAGQDQQICQGDNAYLTATSTGPVVWSTGESTKTIEVVPNETTTYSVTTNNGSCEQTAWVTVMIDTDCGSGEEGDIGSIVFPTVISSQAALHLKYPSKKANTIRIQLVQLSGKTASPILERNVKKGNNTLDLDLTGGTDLSDGLYLLQITDEKSITTKKIIIKK